MQDKNRIINIKMAEYTPVSTDEKVDNSGWVKYGPENDFPEYLIGLSYSTPIHSVLCKGIAEMIAGKGIEGSARATELGFDKLLPKIASDLKKQGGYFLEVIYDQAGRIARVVYLPFTCCRLGINEETEDVNGVWFSKNWKKPRQKQNTPKFLPLFNPKADDKKSQCLYSFEPTDGMCYYPKPDYWGAINDIETARQIGLYDVNSFENGMFPSFIIHMKNGIPEPEEQQQIRGEWDRKLTGAKNTGKYIMTFNDPGADNSPEIEAFPMTEANTTYIDQADKRSTQRIFIGHRVTTPRLFGIYDTGNGLSSNTDEMATGLQILTTQVIEPKQRMICDSFERILSAEGKTEQLTITPNTPIQSAKTTTAPDGSTTSTEDVASTALNGAQIASLIDILVQAATGVIPIESAKGVVVASFPTLTTEQVNDIFTGIVPGSVDPSAVAMKAFLRASTILTKKPHPKGPVELDNIAEELIALGEDCDPDWIFLDSYEVDDEEATKLAVSTGSAKPNASSEQDDTIDDKQYITRYRYSGALSANSRPFCVKMRSANKLYRKEDIIAMGEKSVNPGWGPRGANNYSIWFYKGGGYCGHHWEKVVFVSAKGFGIDVNSPKVQEIAVEKAAAKGYKVRNNAKVATAPFDLPNYGFLPKG